MSFFSVLDASQIVCASPIISYIYIWCHLGTTHDHNSQTFRFIGRWFRHRGCTLQNWHTSSPGPFFPLFFVFFCFYFNCSVSQKQHYLEYLFLKFFIFTFTFLFCFPILHKGVRNDAHGSPFIKQSIFKYRCVCVCVCYMSIYKPLKTIIDM